MVLERARRGTGGASSLYRDNDELVTGKVVDFDFLNKENDFLRITVG